MVDLRVESVSKRYRIQAEDDNQAEGGRFSFGRSSTKDFWALREVNFEVARGESLGIIGHNGAGKSTILKLLSSITTPTKGRITIAGRISALLEVGSGFHPELTGRENIYLSGSILGMRRSEITKKFESIVEFSGVRQFIDIPVKRFSSGMYVRLGFAIAAHMDPDILLLDEVLAVGDRSFQAKCKDRILQLHRQGMTMVFISHDLTAVRNLCSRVILMEKGCMKAEGSAEDVIRNYTESSGFQPATQRQHQDQPAEVTGVEFLNGHEKGDNTLQTGHQMRCRVEYFAKTELPQAAIIVYFLDSNGAIAAQMSTFTDGHSFPMRPGYGSVEFYSAECGLTPGVYSIDIDIDNARTHENLHWQHGCAAVNVLSGKDTRGLFHMPHRWEVRSEPNDAIR